MNPIDPKAVHETLGNILINVVSDLGQIYVGRTIVTIGEVSLDANTCADIASKHGYASECHSIILYTPVDDVHFRINSRFLDDDLKDYESRLRYVFTLRIERIDYDYEDGTYTVDSTLVGS